MKRLKKTIAFLLSFLALSELPMKDGKTAFSDDQKKKLSDAKGEKFTNDVIAAIDKELAAVAKEENDDTEMKAIRKELKEALKDTNMSVEEVLENSTQEGNDGKEINLSAEVHQLVKQLKAHTEQQDKMIQKLIKSPEDDSPFATGKIKQTAKVQHSDTHLFGTDFAYDAFEGRNWNKRAAGKTKRSTDFQDKLVVEQLNKDMKDFYRQNPETIRSLQMDTFGLPSFWHRTLGVRDEISEASIVTDEITQARTANWLPKNKQRIKPETRKVFGIKIDAEFSGYSLQKLEQNWLSQIVNSGSQAYKMPFVEILIRALYKQSSVEDRKACIKGVYTPTPEDSEVPGRAIDRQDGLLINLYRGYMNGKFKIADGIAKPTAVNILDHVQEVIEKNLPEEVKNQAGLVYYLPPTHLRWYKNRYRHVHGTELDFSADSTLTIPNYENIRFETLVDFEGMSFHFITTELNISIDEDVPAEKALHRLEMLKRNIFVIGDYKMGCGPRTIGTKVSDNDPEAFKVQLVWTNGQPFLPEDFYSPVYTNKGDEMHISYKNVYLTNGVKEEIKTITGSFKGEVIQIRGGKGVAEGKMKNGGNFDLDATFTFNTNKTLVLYNVDGVNFKELTRYNNSDTVNSSDFLFDDQVINSEDGVVQVFSGDEAVTITEIQGGAEGQKLTIKGYDDTKTVTIESTTENVKLAGNATAVLKTSDSIEFVKVGDTFLEINRTIA